MGDGTRVGVLVSSQARSEPRRAVVAWKVRHCRSTKWSYGAPPAGPWQPEMAPGAHRLWRGSRPTAPLRPVRKPACRPRGFAPSASSWRATRPRREAQQHLDEPSRMTPQALTAPQDLTTPQTQLPQLAPPLTSWPASRRLLGARPRRPQPRAPEQARWRQEAPLPALLVVRESQSTRPQPLATPRARARAAAWEFVGSAGRGRQPPASALAVQRPGRRDNPGAVSAAAPARAASASRRARLGVEPGRPGPRQCSRSAT